MNRPAANVIVLHGGPAAAGSAAPLAALLAPHFAVLEPHQRGSSDVPLSVATHVADLRELVQSPEVRPRPALVGHSWGAMLALAFAAEHPALAGPLVLVGCGTFDPAARARLVELRDERTSDAMQRDRERLAILEPWIHNSCDFCAEPDPPCSFDDRAHAETWADMLRCQADGRYPAAFAAVASPVLMLHGDWDPHPGPLIRDRLRTVMPQVDYRELPRCGHRPWAEREARADFAAVLIAWLREKLAEERRSGPEAELLRPRRR